MERKKLQSLVLTSAFLILAAGSGSAKSRQKPRFVTDRVAGAQLSEARNEISRDPRTGYYLAGQRECDGGHTGLVLSPQAEQVAKFTGGKSGISGAEIRSRRLSSLATGNGVAIGDNPMQVLRKLGMPTRASPTGRKSKQRVFTYVYRWRDGSLTLEHRSIYTFRGGRLRAIELYEDTVEGG